MRRRIVVLGPLPPPFGGVSLHIVRFLELLKSEGIRATAQPYTGTTRTDRGGKIGQAARMLAGIYSRGWPGRGDVLHIHYGGLGYFLALAPLLALTPARKVITFHSVRVLQDLEGRPAAVRRLALSLLDRFSLFVAVRREIGDDLRTLGLQGPAITVMPAFLPPAPAEQDAARLPAEVAAELVAAQAAGHIQVCCGAYYLGKGYGHEDIYGVESLVSALGRCGETGGRGLDLWVLVSNTPQSRDQVQALEAVQAAAARLPGCRLHLHFGLPLLPVMSRCSGFLRPSREDGDSVAIREALALGMPVLASDVVARPAGVQVYPVAGGLSEALGAFLETLEPVAPGTVRAIQNPDAERYRSFVLEVMGQGAAR
jgi:glycosyltransferase involved in cell wall biosynthesis